LGQLKSERWSAVAEIVEREFFRASEIKSSQFAVFLRRGPSDSSID
jgi:hypothetical protein